MTSGGLLFRLAWRNLGRSPRRTALTGAAIVLGVALCIGIWGITDGLDDDLVSAVTRADLGEVQAHRPGWVTRRPLSLTIPHGAAVARDAARSPGVVAAAPRAYGWAFASGDGRSLGVELMGVDPGSEARVTTLAKKVVRGAFLSEAPTPWPEPKPLDAAGKKVDERLTADATEQAIAEIDALGADAGPPAPVAETTTETRALVAELAPRPLAEPPALLGAKLAERLHARVGGTVAILAQAANGTSVDETLRVVGVFRTGNDAVDQSRVVVHLADLQHMLALGDGVHEIAVRVRDPSAARAVAATLAAQPAFSGLSVEPWQTLRPDVVDMVAVNEGFTEILVVVVFLLAGLGVANTMLMAVFDRRREFGVLRALGLRPRAVLAMVAVETVVLSAFAAAAGVAFGLALDGWLARRGLPIGALGRFSLAGVGVEPMLHAKITERGVLVPVAILVAVAALASLFPAVVAARVPPAAGMRDVG